MGGFLRVILIIGAIMLWLFMMRKIRQSKVKIEYTIFWLAFSAVLIIIGIFPHIVYVLSGIMGFQSPVNLVFLAIIFILIVKIFFMTIQISQLENKIDELAQRVSIDRKYDNSK